MVGGPFLGPFKWLRGAESPLDGCLYHAEAVGADGHVSNV